MVIPLRKKAIAFSRKILSVQSLVAADTDQSGDQSAGNSVEREIGPIDRRMAEYALAPDSPGSRGPGDGL